MGHFAFFNGLDARFFAIMRLYIMLGTWFGSVGRFFGMLKAWSMGQKSCFRVGKSTSIDLDDDKTIEKIHSERVKQMRIFKFRLSVERLLSKAREVSSAMERDADLLEQYGVTAEQRQNFAEAIALADALADDVISRWYVSEAVAARDKKQEQIRAKIEGMVLRVRLCFGAQTPLIGVMDCHNLSQKNTSELLESCQNALAVLSENFAALSVFGLTQPMVDELAAARAELMVLADAVTDAQRERMEMTLRRADALNEIYETMVGFCTIGKLLWVDVNPAKYEDYVIYHTKPKSAPAMPENNIKSDAGENINLGQ